MPVGEEEKRCAGGIDTCTAEKDDEKYPGGPFWYGLPGFYFTFRGFDNGICRFDHGFSGFCSSSGVLSSRGWPSRAMRSVQACTT